jgi:hypothetical protein
MEKVSVMPTESALKPRAVISQGDILNLCQRFENSCGGEDFTEVSSILGEFCSIDCSALNDPALTRTIGEYDVLGLLDSFVTLDEKDEGTDQKNIMRALVLCRELVINSDLLARDFIRRGIGFHLCSSFLFYCEEAQVLALQVLTEIFRQPELGQIALIPKSLTLVLDELENGEESGAFFRASQLGSELARYSSVTNSGLETNIEKWGRLLRLFVNIVHNRASDVYSSAFLGIVRLCVNRQEFLHEKWNVWPCLKWAIYNLTECSDVFWAMGLLKLFCRPDFCHQILNGLGEDLMIIWDHLWSAVMDLQVKKIVIDVFICMIKRDPSYIGRMVSENVFFRIKDLLENAPCSVRVHLCSLVAKCIIIGSREVKASILQHNFFGAFFDVLEDVKYLEGRILRALNVAVKTVPACLPMFCESDGLGILESYDPSDEKNRLLIEEILDVAKR